MNIDICRKCDVGRCLLLFLNGRHADDGRRVVICQNDNGNQVKMYGYDGAFNLAMRSRGLFECVIEKYGEDINTPYFTNDSVNFNEYILDDEARDWCPFYAEQLVSSMEKENEQGNMQKMQSQSLHNSSEKEEKASIDEKL